MRGYHEVLDTDWCIHVCVFICMEVSVFMCVCERERDRERERERNTKLCKINVYTRFLCKGLT